MKKIIISMTTAAALFFMGCQQTVQPQQQILYPATNPSNSDNDSSDSTLATETVPEDETPASGTSFVSSQTLYINLTDSQFSEDNSSWSQITTSKNKIFSKSANIKFSTDSESVSTGVIKIDLSEVTANTSVQLTGTMTTGGVKIQTNPEYETGLYLNGVSITSSNYPAIEVTKGGAVSVFLTGSNILKDGRTFGTGYGEEYSTVSTDTYEDDDGNIVSCTIVSNAQREGSDSKGTLYSKGSMTISGTGSLKITEGYKHCIASKAYLTLESGTYNLTSTGKSGFYGDCGIIVKNGNYTFNGTGEISSTKYHKAHAFNVDDDTYTDAFVKIYGGVLNLTSYNGKGITAPIVEISGGTVTVNSTGVTGYTNDDNKKASYIDADGIQYTNASVTFAAEGIEGAQSIKISGGTIEVTSTDDALNVSNVGATFTMTNGNLYAYSTKGDGIDCNGNIIITGGTIVSYAPTGSEDALDCGDGGYSIKISGGTIAAVSGSSRGTESLTANGSQHILYSAGSSQGGMGGRPGQSTSTNTSFSTVLVKINSTQKFCFKMPASSFGLLMLTSPEFTSSNASSYEIYPSASISGGTDFHGLYTTLPSITSTGTSTTLNIK